MKINQLFTVFLLFVSAFSVAPENERVEVNGKIVVDKNEVEGVTVFNQSSQQGTVSDAEGNFTILVAVNDKVNFGALQFQDFTVIITEEIIASKEMTVHLIEEVNKLPEVVILPYGLTGNLDEDVGSVSVDNPDLDALYFGLDNLDKIEFTPDHLTGVNNTALEERRLVYGFDPISIIGSLAGKLFRSKKKIENVPIQERKSIMQVYAIDYLIDALKMGENDIVEFVYFIEESQFDLALLDDKRELEFLDYLDKKKKEFLDIKNGRN